MDQEKKDKALAADLSRIAMGDAYSEKVVRASVERLQELREGAASEAAAERIQQAVVACKLALHGVPDVFHQLQDASVLIAQANGPVAEVAPTEKMPMPAATEDPLFRAQIDALKSTTAAINEAYVPDNLKADFQVARLREFAQDLELEFDGEIIKLDGGTQLAEMKRKTEGDMEYRIALMLPPEMTHITAYAGLIKEDVVLIESAAMQHKDVLHALDAAVDSFDGLKVKAPVAEVTTQAEAQVLVRLVAAEMDASLGEWVQSQAQEWQRNTLVAPDGRAVTVSTSTGGVVNVNGDPYTPQERLLNVTHATVSESIQSAVDLAPMPVVPIKMDRVFADATGELGTAWANLCEAENRLAGYLTVFEDGTAVTSGDHAWYLQKEDDKLVLMHANVTDGRLEGATSRFDFALEWVDIEAAEVQDYADRVNSVSSDYLIDRELLKTIKVEHEESPSMGM